MIAEEMLVTHMGSIAENNRYLPTYLRSHQHS